VDVGVRVGTRYPCVGAGANKPIILPG